MELKAATLASLSTSNALNPFNGIERSYLGLRCRGVWGGRIHSMELKVVQGPYVHVPKANPSNPFNGIERLENERDKVGNIPRESIQWN